jgi:hypothetical protein
LVTAGDLDRMVIILLLGALVVGIRSTSGDCPGRRALGAQLGAAESSSRRSTVV